MNTSYKMFYKNSSVKVFTICVIHVNNVFYIKPTHLNKHVFLRAVQLQRKTITYVIQDSLYCKKPIFQ